MKRRRGRDHVMHGRGLCVSLSRRYYSTVTDFARLRGWSTSQPRRTAM
ncbi:MAG TPA: hypothetical protein VF754_05175 [Pyrinomonadaceae bacterium]